MKRDMELIHKILIALEDSNQTQGWIPLKFDGYSEEQISYHIKILDEQGIITATDCSTSKDFMWHARSLTWDGHDYIEAIRDEAKWKKVKEWVKSTGKVLTIETIKLAIEKLFF